MIQRYPTIAKDEVLAVVPFVLVETLSAMTGKVGLIAFFGV